MNVLCTVCARGGSKGVPGKNLRVLAGKPLIVHTLEQARRVKVIQRIVVSTDSEEIARVATAAGVDVPFRRPPELATDGAAKLPVIQHALRTLEMQEGREYDVVVDLDPTSPLRRSEDIEGALACLEERKADVVITACESSKNPYFNMVELDGEGWARLSKAAARTVVRRQDAPKVYAMNASIYVFRRKALLESRTLFEGRTALYAMPQDRSVDIDREIDFLFVEMLLNHGAR